MVFDIFVDVVDVSWRYFEVDLNVVCCFFVWFVEFGLEVDELIFVYYVVCLADLIFCWLIFWFEEVLL